MVQEVDPRTAHDAVAAGALLVDVREPWEWEEERIPGAVLIPMGQVPERLTEIPLDRDVYVHCKSGSRSARVVQYLQANGHTRAANVEGGIQRWAQEGLPTEPPQRA